MGHLSNKEERILKNFLNLKRKNIPNLLRKKLFQKYYPNLDYKEFMYADLWISILFCDYQYLINDNYNNKISNIKNISNNKNLWGKGDIGPVG